jgi:hypothetical protein
MGATHRLDATRFRHLLQDQHSNRCHPPISCQHSNRCHPPISCQHSNGAVNRCHHRYPARAGRPCQCAFDGVETGGFKSLHGFDLDPLINSNCVPAKGGGEQLTIAQRFQSVPPTNLMPAFQLLSIGATFAIQHGRDARATRGRLRARLTTRIPIFGVDDYSRSFQATMAVPSGDRPRPFPLGAR